MMTYSVKNEITHHEFTILFDDIAMAQMKVSDLFTLADIKYFSHDVFEAASKNVIEVNEITEVSDSQLQINITGINDFTTSEIREIIEDSFYRAEPINNK
jgi:hypothetical protein